MAAHKFGNIKKAHGFKGRSMVGSKKVQKAPSRLYQKAVICSYKRSRKSQYQGQTLVKISGVKTAEDVNFYSGKKIAYVYKTKKETKGSKFRVIWGKVRRAHGHNGIVRAAFKKNLPPTSFGAPARVMLYPSSI